MIKLNSTEWNLLHAFAARNDVRFYLNGIYFTSKYACATNGHRLVKVTYPPIETEDVILAIDKQTPRANKRDNVTVKLNTGENQSTVEFEGSSIRQSLHRHIDGKFPNIDDLLESHKKDENDTLPHHVGLNMKYLKELAILGPTKLTFHNDSQGPVYFTSPDHPSITCIVMPCRVDR